MFSPPGLPMTPDSLQSRSLTLSRRNLLHVRRFVLFCPAVVHAVTPAVALRRHERTTNKMRNLVDGLTGRICERLREIGSAGGLGSSQPSDSNHFHLVCSANEKKKNDLSLFLSNPHFCIRQMNSAHLSVSFSSFLFFIHENPDFPVKYFSCGNYYSHLVT